MRTLSSSEVLHYEKTLEPKIHLPESRTGRIPANRRRRHRRGLLLLSVYNLTIVMPIEIVVSPPTVEKSRPTQCSFKY